MFNQTLGMIGFPESVTFITSLGTNELTAEFVCVNLTIRPIEMVKAVDTDNKTLLSSIFTRELQIITMVAVPIMAFLMVAQGNFGRLYPIGKM